METIGQQIRSIRIELGLSKRALAKKAGLHPITIDSAENEITKTQQKTFDKIISAFQSVLDENRSNC